MKVMMFARSRFSRMNRSEDSTASVPLTSNETRLRGSGAMETSFSASSTTGGDTM